MVFEGGAAVALVDFKTTSCCHSTKFLDTVDNYDYGRQAARYADVLRAQRVLPIAVQKHPLQGQPPTVWGHELTANQLVAGRKKYARLLRAYVA